MTNDGPSLGQVLREARRRMGMTQRQVEMRSCRVVTNAHLSQIETGTIKRPSPIVLFQLAEIYWLDFPDLLLRAGHDQDGEVGTAVYAKALAGLPLWALQQLDADERRDLKEYIEVLLQRRAFKDEQQSDPPVTGVGTGNTMRNGAKDTATRASDLGNLGRHAPR